MDEKISVSNDQQTAEQTITIDPTLARRIQEEIGQNVYLCYQCIKCSSGCPLGEFYDWQPNQIMRALQLGQEDIALKSKTPWLCASCQTCSTRCPQGLDITAIMEFLTREALERGIKPQIPEVMVFNEAFLREIRFWGRAYEPGMMVEMKLRNPQALFNDVDLYTRMLRKMKVGLFPSPARPPHKVKPIPGAADAIAYYPGCSLHSTSPEFNISTEAVCETLGLKLIEPHGWMCCGSSPAHRSNPEFALRLPMENLALFERSGFQEVTMPCAACFNHFKTVLHEMRHNEQHRRAMTEEIGYAYQDKVQVNTLVQTINKHASKDTIAKNVKKPLDNLRVVCYYGCLLTRPPQVTGAEHPENPTDMDELITALGAQVLDWSYKTVCCGATHSLTCPEIVIKLSSDLIKQAQHTGADLIAVACPLCHANLDARQFQMKLEEPMPILFFTQLMALAMDLPDKASMLHKNLVDPRPVLRTKGVISTP